MVTPLRGLAKSPPLGEGRGSGVDRVGGEDGAVEDNAVAGPIGRGEPAVLDPDQLRQRAEVG
jgi:hypothetical protein